MRFAGIIQVISKFIAIICATVVAAMGSASARDRETHDCRTIVGGQVICGNLVLEIAPERNKASLKKLAEEIRADEAEERDLARTGRTLAGDNKAEPLYQQVPETFRSKPSPPASDIVGEAVSHPPGLPAIGKWMISQGGVIADWLGKIHEGKKLHEPINLILVDWGAASVADARARLVAAVTAAGYAVRFGHSAGYRGFIGGMVYDQLPTGFDDAFSDAFFEETNNHGRVFGPHRFGESYVFIAAFSRERFNLLEWPWHQYASFNQARDDFARHLHEKSVFKAAGFVRLDNALVDHPAITTGDHDGRAVVLRVRK